MDAPTLASFSLEEAAARCVKCALCLPHCPTYRLKGEEGDSPRGRIALIQSLAEGSLAPDASVIAHLDGCLDCRACEAVCPAEVPYGRLIDGARDELKARKSRGLRNRLLQFAIGRPRMLAALLRTLRIPARLCLPRSSRLRAYADSLRRMPALARGPEDGEPAALFLGCIARAADTEALAASAALLAAAGYRVAVPSEQTCCGALAGHAGDHAQAAALARRNIEAFAGHNRIIAAATGCTAYLSEYQYLLDDGGDFSRKVLDVTEAIAQALETKRLTIRNDKHLRVAVHTPCTQRNVLRSDALQRALAQVPNLHLTALPAGCCGAAGSYFLDRPDDADRLREPLLNAIRAADADFVVTANIGCRLHLGAGLAAAETAPEVLHLATFLARFPRS